MCITSLNFAPGYADAAFKLFELDEKVLQELLADAGRFARAPGSALFGTPLRHQP
jgi:hypothetical protein